MAAFFYTSCQKEGVEDETLKTEPSLEENLNQYDANDEASFSDEDNYSYNYKGEAYSRAEIDESFPDLLMNSYVLFEEDDSLAYVFKEESEALDFEGNSQLSKSDCKNDNNFKTWGFKVRFYEHEDFKGKWFQHRRHGIPRSQKYVSKNVRPGFNDRISSIVVDEIDNALTSSGTESWVIFSCWEDYNASGRRADASLIFRCKRAFSNLRDGNWNDKISHWRVAGGTGK